MDGAARAQNTITVGDDGNVGIIADRVTASNINFNFGHGDGEASKFMAFLASDYCEHKDRNPERVPGTCNWFLEHSQFLEWRRDPSKNLLWVSADPGCGKSVLSRALVDEGLLNAAASDITCYFFFKEDDIDRRSGADALCAILHQLFTRKPELLARYALGPWKNNGTKLRTQFGTLWNILMAATAHLDPDDNAGCVICVLDALDECEPTARKTLIEKLSRFHLDRKQTKSRLKFVVTSRPYADIQGQFGYNIRDLPSIHLKGDAESETIRREIDLYIEHEIPRISHSRHPPLSSKIQDRLVERLKEAENRTYLWLHLVLYEIRSSLEYTTSKLEALLEELPGSVADAYHNILERVTTEERGGMRVSNPKRVQEVKRLLHIIVAAERPLTLREMNTVLDILENENQGKPCQYDESWDAQDPDSLSAFEQKVRNLCGLFVSVKDSRVYLIHQTAREFLIDNSSEAGFARKYSLTPAKSHFLLAAACVSYIGLAIFQDDRLPGPINTRQFSNWSIKYGFLGYAVYHCASHVKLEGVEATTHPSQLAQLACSVCASRPRLFYDWFYLQCSRFDNWTRTEGEHFRRGWTDLGVASYFGLEQVVCLLAERRSGVDGGAADMTAALHFAAMNGEEGVVSFLLERAVLCDSTDDSGLTALHVAAMEGQEGTVRLLLDKGAPINTCTENPEGATALHLAVMHGRMAVMRLLVGRNADVNVQMSDGTTALSTSIDMAYDMAVQEDYNDWSKPEFLLQAGADWRVGKFHMPDALFIAAQSGQDVLVQLFLTRGYDVDEKSVDGRTPLIAAAECGHAGVVRLLAQNGANVNAVDPFGCTALLGAAKEGHPVVAKILIQNGADINKYHADENYPSPGRFQDDFLNPLHWAARNGHTDVVKLLIRHGSEINAKTHANQTALILAAEHGRVETAKLLIESGADIHAMSQGGETALQWAVYNEHQDLVQFLTEAAERELTPA